MEKNEVRDAVLEVMESSLDAQLKAIRKLRKGNKQGASECKGMSQIDMAHDILSKSRAPMHINAIIEKIRQRFGHEIDRESLVSALTKRVARGDRFERTDKNTFALRSDPLK